MKYYKGATLLDNGVQFVFALVFVGILLGVGAVALNSMNSYNGVGGVPATQASGVFNTSMTGIGNLSGQLPTVGTIAGVGLIILVLFVAIGGYIMAKK